MSVTAYHRSVYFYIHFITGISRLIKYFVKYLKKKFLAKQHYTISYTIIKISYINFY